MRIKSRSTIPLDQRFALTIAESAELAGVGRSAVYAAVTSKELRAKKRGTSTVILPADLREWLDRLPDFTPSYVAAGKPRAEAVADAAAPALAANTAPARKAAAKPRLAAVE
jgi:excisionase family DNA binding protein